MKKTLSILLAASAALIIAGCQKDPIPDPQKGEFEVKRMRDLGEVSPNPVNLSHCILPGAKETLESFRHVSKGRLYYMDYIAEFPFEEMIVRDPKLRYKPDDYREMAFRLNTLLYNDAIMGEEAPYSLRSCSGFVCHNPQGQLLFGRNMDSGSGNLIVTFHGNQKNGYKFVMMTNQAYVDVMNGIKEPDGKADGIFMNKETDLSLALRQPMVSLDGMNEHGLCFAVYQLPNFEPEKALQDSHMPMPVDQNNPSSEGQITSTTLHYLILSKCRTVKEVEMLLEKYDYVTIWNCENVHWYVADAEGDYAVFEYWGRGTTESPYELHVMRYNDRFKKTNNATYYGVPYEYNSIENYYCNQEAALNYNQDKWQFNFSNKVRVHHMMSAYKPVMSEKEALLCLQEGSFGIETPDDVTNWSCVYNPAERTMLFNMRNDMSEVYSIDLKKDL